VISNAFISFLYMILREKSSKLKAQSSKRMVWEGKGRGRERELDTYDESDRSTHAFYGVVNENRLEPTTRVSAALSRERILVIAPSTTPFCLFANLADDTTDDQHQNDQNKYHYQRSENDDTDDGTDQIAIIGRARGLGWWAALLVVVRVCASKSAWIAAAQSALGLGTVGSLLAAELATGKQVLT
jgi:hypothetical protein